MSIIAASAHLPEVKRALRIVEEAHSKHRRMTHVPTLATPAAPTFQTQQPGLCHLTLKRLSPSPPNTGHRQTLRSLTHGGSPTSTPPRPWIHATPTDGPLANRHPEQCTTPNNTSRINTRHLTPHKTSAFESKPPPPPIAVHTQSGYNVSGFISERDTSRPNTTDTSSSQRWTALSTQHSALSTQYSALSTQYSALSTQHSALSSQHSAFST